MADRGLSLPILVACAVVALAAVLALPAASQSSPRRNATPLAPVDAGLWSVPQWLGDTPGTNTGLDSVPALGMSDDGWAFALSSDRHVAVLRAAPGRGFGPAVQLAGTNASQTQIAVGASGVTAMSWLQFDDESDQTFAGGDVCCERLRAAVTDQTGRISPVDRLSAAGDDASDIVLGAGAEEAGAAWTDPLGLGMSIGTPTRGFGAAIRVPGPAQRSGPLEVWFAGNVMHALTLGDSGELFDVAVHGSRARVQPLAGVSRSLVANWSSDDLGTISASSSSGTLLQDNPGGVVLLVSPHPRWHATVIGAPRPYAPRNFDAAAFARMARPSSFSAGVRSCSSTASILVTACNASARSRSLAVRTPRLAISPRASAPMDASRSPVRWRFIRWSSSGPGRRRCTSRSCSGAATALSSSAPRSSMTPTCPASSPRSIGKAERVSPSIATLPTTSVPRCTRRHSARPTTRQPARRQEPPRLARPGTCHPPGSVLSRPSPLLRRDCATGCTDSSPAARPSDTPHHATGLENTPT